MGVREDVSVFSVCQLDFYGVLGSNHLHARASPLANPMVHSTRLYFHLSSLRCGSHMLPTPPWAAVRVLQVRYLRRFRCADCLHYVGAPSTDFHIIVALVDSTDPHRRFSIQHGHFINVCNFHWYLKHPISVLRHPDDFGCLPLALAQLAISWQPQQARSMTPKRRAWTTGSDMETHRRALRHQWREVAPSTSRRRRSPAKAMDKSTLHQQNQSRETYLMCQVWHTRHRRSCRSCDWCGCALVDPSMATTSRSRLSVDSQPMSYTFHTSWYLSWLMWPFVLHSATFETVSVWQSWNQWPSSPHA